MSNNVAETTEGESFHSRGTEHQRQIQSLISHKSKDSNTDQTLGETKLVKKESFCRVFCECNLKSRCLSINKRRPSALHALDGLRAIAILWVYYYHSALNFLGYKFLPYFHTLKKNDPLLFILTPLQNGDLGVDIFFVLSGFLISFILLKECDKYEGKIDILGFFRSRVIRLWFAMVVYCLVAASPLFGAPWGYWLPPLFFVGNIIGHTKMHLWSVSVEFQFYLISPFIVYWMRRGRYSPWIAAAVIFTISTLARVVISLVMCPGIWDNEALWQDQTNKCLVYEWFFVYQQMITRASPYGFGMLAATLFHKNKGKDYLKETNIVLEWFAFLLLMTIGWVGPNLPADFHVPQIKFLWFVCISRSLYGAVLAYLILLCVSANTDTYHYDSSPIPWYRPTRWMRAFLCMNIWLPIATVSYSMYIWHLILIQSLFPKLANFAGLQDEAKNGITEWSPKYAGWLFLFMLIVFIPTVILSILSYVFIEKASIDARRVFKNKYAAK